MISYSNPSSSVAMGELAKVVGSPFNKQETDILCSSDQPTPTDFRVFKSPPALASPFFASVFTLPQPVTDGSYGIPVMQMQEDERTLTLTLGFCFFISVNRPPRLDYLEDIHRVIKAAVKFEMKGVEEYVEAKLLDGFIRDKPFQVFAIACHYGWKREARVAASFSLLPSLFLPETTAAFYEPNLITAATYHRLMQYRRECMTAAGREVIRLIEASDCSSRPWSVDPDQRRVCKGRYSTCNGPRKWWITWMSNIVIEAISRIPRRKNFSTSSKVGIKICDDCSKSVRIAVSQYIPVILERIEKKINKVNV